MAAPSLITSRDTGVWFFECANCGTDACVVNLDSLSQAFLIAKQAGWKHTTDGQEFVCADCIKQGKVPFWALESGDVQEWNHHIADA